MRCSYITIHRIGRSYCSSNAMAPYGLEKGYILSRKLLVILFIHSLFPSPFQHNGEKTDIVLTKKLIENKKIFLFLSFLLLFFSISAIMVFLIIYGSQFFVCSSLIPSHKSEGERFVFDFLYLLLIPANRRKKPREIYYLK